MGRRNYFLIISLLVMLGALLGAILVGNQEGDAPDRVEPAAGVPGDEPVAEGAVVSDLGTEPGAREDSAADAAGAAPRTEVETPPGAASRPITLRGRLVDAAGRPAAEKTLRFTRIIEDAGFVRMPSDFAQGPDAERRRQTTDGDGRFEFEVDSGARGSLVLTRDADLLFEESGHRTHAVAASDVDVDLGDVLVKMAASISGRVVDQSDQPIADALVRAPPSESSSIWGLDRSGETTDDDGRFVLTGLVPGEHRLQVSAAGFVPAWREVQLEPGTRRDDVVLALTRGASIAGTVLDDLGHPLAAAKVAMFRDQKLGAAVEVSTLDLTEAIETDENGYFILSGIDRPSVSLRAWADGHGTEQVGDVAVGTGNLVIRLARHGKISGVLVDTTGAPIEGSRVSASRGQMPRLVELETLRGARTEADGRFVIEGVRPGTATLTARGPGHLPVEGFSVQVRSGETTDNVRLVAEIGAVVAALVVDGDGAPIEGATVRVVESEDPVSGGARARGYRRSVRREEEDGDVRISLDGGAQTLGRGVSDAEGKVRIAGLPAREVQLETEHAEYAPARPAKLSLPRRGAVEAVLTMRPGGFVQVASVTADGEPLAMARFALRGPIMLGESPSEVAGRTDADGTKKLGPLAEGTYELAMRLAPRPFSIGNSMQFTTSEDGEELAQTRRQVVVRAGESVEVELVRPILTRLTGVVRDAEGPAGGIELRLREASSGPDPLGRAGFMAKSDADGRYAIENVPAGDYRLEFGRPEQILPQVETLDVPPEQAELVRDLALRGGTIRLHVTSDEDDMPVARADVSLEREGEEAPPARRGMVMIRIDAEQSGGGGVSQVSLGNGARSVKTDDDGNAVLEGVPPGEYTVVVRHNRHVVERVEDVAVTDRAVTDAGTVELHPAGHLNGNVIGLPADGIGIALVEIRQKDGDGEPRRETAMRGAFRVDSLAPGAYVVRARALGPPDAEEVWGPEREVVVQAGKTARIEVPIE